MKRKATFQYTIYIVVLIGFFIFLVDCGSDEAAPADPSTTSVIPDIVFFNTGVASPSILLEGKAFDNMKVVTVELSFNGSSWNAASILPPGGDNEVDWSYPASSGEISASINTIVIRATDSSDNISVSDPVIVEMQKGSSIPSLLAVFTGPSAASSGDVVALSSGIGGAYGNSIVGPSIPIDVNLTVLGSGYGSTSTSGGLSFPAVASTATILQSPVSSASIFSVDADLTLKNMRLLGAENAVRIWDSAGPDPQLSVEDCVFDRQETWAVYADDDDGGVSVDFISSIVDASKANSPSGGGGLYLENVNYTVTGSEFYLQSATAPGAGVQAVGGTGNIYNSLFTGNALAIWASGGSPIISSCNITGYVSTTSSGVLFTGDSFGTPMLISNRISENKGSGVVISGDAPVIFEQNSISLNGSGGVVIDYDFPASSSLPVLGDCQAYNICDEGGRNSIFSNLPYDAIATANTGGEDLILAQGNYWGATKIWSAHVDQVIKDGDTLLTTLRVPPLFPDLGEDSPNAWAKLNFLPFDATGIDPNE